VAVGLERAGHDLAQLVVVFDDQQVPGVRRSGVHDTRR
jgi:hypothetical protein